MPYKDPEKIKLYAKKYPEQKEHSKDGMKLWMRTMSLKRFQDKILGTDLFLLCSNCHIELHSGVWEHV